MTDSVITYGIFGIVALLTIFSFAIGIEKMIRIILGNYILTTICLAASQSLYLLVNFLNTTPLMKVGGFSYGDIATFLQQGKVTIIIVLYVLLMLLMYNKSKIRMSLPDDDIIKKSLVLLLVPLTVVSIILALEIAILGADSINILALQTLASSLTTNIYLTQFITMTPVWILVHGLATVLISSEIKISLKTDL